jgi:hypothetical protein
MRRFAPLLTLLAVAVLGGALLTLNVLGDPANQTAQPTAAAGSEPAAAAAPTPAPAPPPTSAPPAAPAGEAPAVAEKAYAGRSAGNEVTVAIAVKNGRAVGYVCDGTVSGSDLTLKSKDGTSTIEGTVDDKQSFGTVAVNGKQWPFAAKAASSPAGLYEGRAQVRGVLNRIGWIMLPDGSQTGVWNRGSEEVAAPVLDPTRLDAVVIDGVQVTVRTVGGNDAVIAR